MQGGTKELVRATTVYVTCLTFALTYLLTLLLGADGGTAVIRGIVVAAATFVLGGFLFRPVISTLLDGIAKHQATSAEGDE